MKNSFEADEELGEVIGDDEDVIEDCDDIVEAREELVDQGLELKGRWRYPLREKFESEQGVMMDRASDVSRERGSWWKELTMSKTL